MTDYLATQCGPHRLLLPSLNIDHLDVFSDAVDVETVAGMPVFDSRILFALPPSDASERPRPAIYWRSSDLNRRCVLLVDELGGLVSLTAQDVHPPPRLPRRFEGLIDGVVYRAGTVAFRLRPDACVPTRSLCKSRIRTPKPAKEPVA